MKSTCFFAFFPLLLFTGSLHAQEPVVYQLNQAENNRHEPAAFISLSDSYRLSDHPDSLAIPDLAGKTEEEAHYFKLEERYRNRFLSGTGISETDRVFIYDYAADKLVSFAVKELDVVASISPYTVSDEWPYSQYDYMIGFDVDNAFLKGFSDYFTTALVSVGKESPFVRGQLKPVRWKKSKPADFPSNAVFPAVIYEEPVEYMTGAAYTSESKGLRYTVQDLLLNGQVEARRLVVIELKTKAIRCEKIYAVSEGTSLAPLNFVDPDGGKYVQQWAGRLFVSKPPVIFGFQYESFGCPEITFLERGGGEVYIKCDNRH